MKRYIKSAITPLSEESEEVQRKIATSSRNNPMALDKLAEALLEDPTSYDKDTLWYIVENPNTLPQTLDKLADADIPFVKISVAQCPRTPVETLRKLSKSSSSNVLYGLITNPNTPDDVLAKISHVVPALAINNRGLEIYINFDYISDYSYFAAYSDEAAKLETDVTNVANTALLQVGAAVARKHVYLDRDLAAETTKNSDGTYTHHFWASFPISIDADMGSYHHTVLDSDACRKVRAGILSGMTKLGYTVNNIEFDLL